MKNAIRGKEVEIVLPSAARTATTNSQDVYLGEEIGLAIFLNVTVAGTGNLTVQVSVKDPVSGSYRAVVFFNTTGITAAALVYDVIYPGLTSSLSSVANGTYPMVLSGMVRVTVSHTDGSAWTYSVAVEKIP